ncbi:Protein AGENET DOMAIN (AGD)-CONTAINING P1 [Cardamine amara subsp. amara]|uniref:Protein AGENET DOMAIN (AGD)-CONTAINING P1 n=1 Tax=Cardamine amara subsp. amara TaxID=228776 RepID=A0ABD1C7R0_CARAN
MSLRPRQSPGLPSPANQRRKALKKSINSRPNRNRLPCYLKPGATVEINPEDPDFRGSWFLGKVVSIQSSDKIQVEYNTLLDEETGTKLLKEDIDMSRLRPPAPLMSEREKKKVIVVGDKVDAFYGDGWWEGDVTEVLADGKFSVYFRCSQELISFTKNQLRFHREWVDDAWEPPLAEKESEEDKADGEEDDEDVLSQVDLEATRAIAKQMFSSGTVVEVSSDDEGFQGCWFAAKVIERIGEDKYLVEYRDLREEDGIEPLKEETDFIHIRPPPPREEDVDFAVGDKVDAFYNDGWWVGVVNDGFKDGTVGVFFRLTREKMRFGRQGLRLHKDWVNGTWQPPLKGEEIKRTNVSKVSCDRSVRPKKTIEKQEFSIGATVEVSSEEEGFEDSWFLARVIEYRGDGKCLLEYDNIKAEDGKEPLREEVDVSLIRPQPLESVMVSPFERHDKVDALYNDGWWVGVIVKVLAKANYLVTFEKTQETLRFHHSQLRPHQEWIDGKWITSSKSQKV